MADQPDYPIIPNSIADRSQFFYTALSMLMARQQNSVMPELLYFMSPDQVLTFIATYEGSTVRVPTMKEIGEDLMTALAAYYLYGQKLTEQATQDKLKLTDAKWRVILNRLVRWKEHMAKEAGVDVEELVK
jgi:hypothetical protein